jgi:hypothetical protein
VLVVCYSSRLFDHSQCGSCNILQCDSSFDWKEEEEGSYWSNLIRHFRFKHTETWDKLDAIRLQSQKRPTHKSWTLLQDEAASAIRERKRKATVTKTMDTYVRVRAKRDDEQSLHVVRSIVMCAQPLSLLDSDHYKEQQSVRAGCQCSARGKSPCAKCKVPSSTSARNIIQRFDQAIVLHIREMLGSIDAISLTADGWTDARGHKIIGVTGHWYHNIFSIFLTLTC